MVTMNKVKFSVGYPCAAPQSFFNSVAPYLDRIGELYFAWDGFATGRATFENDPRYDRPKLESELCRFREQGIRLNVLLNGNCFGGEAISRQFAERVCTVVGDLHERFGIDAVTTASPFVAHAVKSAFPQLDVRASVNMWVDGVAGMAQCADLFDSFYVKRDYHYCPDELRAEHDWCRENGKRLYLLANSGCIPNCAYHIFHDNFVSHSAEVAKSQKDATFEPYACRRMMAKRDNRHLILAGNLVRPEDVHHYEDLVDGIKLATRIHPFPAIVIGAYARGRWPGDVSALTEPGFGDLLAPNILDNTAIPATYWEQKTTCARAKAHGSTAHCRECGYCDAVYHRILTPME